MEAKSLLVGTYFLIAITSTISKEDKGGDNCFISKELLQISSCSVVNYVLYSLLWVQRHFHIIKVTVNILRWGY